MHYSWRPRHAALPSAIKIFINILLFSCNWAIERACLTHTHTHTHYIRFKNSHYIFRRSKQEQRKQATTFVGKKCCLGGNDYHGIETAMEYRLRWGIVAMEYKLRWGIDCHGIHTATEYRQLWVTSYHGHRLPGGTEFGLGQQTAMGEPYLIGQGKYAFSHGIFVFLK